MSRVDHLGMAGNLLCSKLQECLDHTFQRHCCRHERHERRSIVGQGAGIQVEQEHDCSTQYLGVKSASFLSLSRRDVEIHWSHIPAQAQRVGLQLPWVTCNQLRWSSIHSLGRQSLQATAARLICSKYIKSYIKSTYLAVASPPAL